MEQLFHKNFCVTTTPTPYQFFYLRAFKRYGKLPPERFHFVRMGGIYVFPRNCLGIPPRTDGRINFRIGMVKSKIKNLILSLMAIQAEMRGKEHEDLGQIIILLRRFADDLKEKK